MTATVSRLIPIERLRTCLPHTAKGADDLTPIASLGFDSLDTVEFLCAVHEEFGVRLTTSDFPSDQTLSGLLSRITQQQTTDSP